MQSDSLNVVFKSVAISIANISTALLSRLNLCTKSSLAKIAQAAPSDVGLKFIFLIILFESKLKKLPALKFS